MFARLALLPPTHIFTHVSTREHSLSQDWGHCVAEMRFSFFFPPSDGSGDYTHLLRDTDGDDRAAGVPGGHRAHGSSATWQRLPFPSCSEEVSPSICVREGDGAAGPGLLQEHAINILKNRYLFSRWHALAY